MCPFPPRLWEERAFLFPAALLPRVQHPYDGADQEEMEESMISLATTQVWVRDQDEALAFWVERVGFEVKEDVTIPELGFFRWVTVGPRDQGGTAIVLMAIPGEPVMDDATRAQVQDLVSKGFATALFFTTDDVRAVYDRLVAAGVETTGEPTQQVYGEDFGFRDPSGNHFRVATRRQIAT